MKNLAYLSVGTAQREIAELPSVHAQSSAQSNGVPIMSARVVAVVPAYRAGTSIVRVVEKALRFVDAIIVVDDSCPERCGEIVALAFQSARVRVVVHERNRGVGAAVKTGFREALRMGAAFVVKIDSDDQMDASFVPDMIAVLEASPNVDFIKGNRFAHAATMTTMPIARLIGNSALTLLVKFSSGYWTIVDPTNGFFAIRTNALDHTALSRLADRYFFEIDLLCSLGVERRVIAEFEMPAIYGDEKSSLSIGHVVASFPGLLFSRFLRRILINYLLVEINVGSLCWLFGVPLLIFALIFGGQQWIESLVSGTPRATGTIILSLLPFMVGCQLCLQAILYDVQFAIRTIKLRRASGSAMANS